MEDVLDGISRGESERLAYLRDFYFGTPDLPGITKMIKAEIDPRQACTLPLGRDFQSREITVRVGKFGPYVERGDERASIPAGMAPDELTIAVAEELLVKGANPGILGQDPATGKTIYVKVGRFGPYVMLGEQGEEPKMKSLLPGQTPETLTLDQALQLLTLPREVGIDPATQEPIRADLGRYGPYLRKGTDSRSLPSPESIFTTTLDQALEIFAKPKSFRRGQATVLREVGKHPTTELAINLMKGKFGPYVTDGEINASVPRTMSPEQLTLADAVQLIADRAAFAPKKKAPKRPGKKKPARASAVKSAKPKGAKKFAKSAVGDGAPPPTARPKGKVVKRARG